MSAPLALQEQSVSELGESPKRARDYSHLKQYHFKIGDPSNPAKINPLAHRQKGMHLASTVFNRAAKSLAEKEVKLALRDGHKEQGASLRHALDKLVPDAGADAAPVADPVQIVIVLRDRSERVITGTVAADELSTRNLAK